jgi:hypothetical protein
MGRETYLRRNPSVFCGVLRAENRSESSYRFRTPECDVRMSVQFLANSSTEGFHIRDRVTNRTFCLSTSEEENHGCLERFVGAMAIARYAFRSRRHSAALPNLRERVLTIDNDSRITPPPPFERVLAVEQEVVSDIQALPHAIFGLNGKAALGVCSVLNSQADIIFPHPGIEGQRMVHLAPITSQAGFGKRFVQ